MGAYVGTLIQLVTQEYKLATINMIYMNLKLKI